MHLTESVRAHIAELEQQQAATHRKLEAAKAYLATLLDETTVRAPKPTDASLQVKPVTRSGGLQDDVMRIASSLAPGFTFADIFKKGQAEGVDFTEDQVRQVVSRLGRRGSFVVTEPGQGRRAAKYSIAK